MSFEKLENKLNKNINEETALVNKISLFKYILIYVLLLFLMFATTTFIGGLLFESVVFDWREILIQAVVFSVFFKVFHYMRKGWNDAWKNK